MKVPEQAVIGNSNLLATIGKHGELRYLFWPTIGYPEHVLGSLPGLFYATGNMEKFGWLTDPPWKRKQEYVGDSNILVTSFLNSKVGIRSRATDFVLPNTDVVVRHFSFQNVSPTDVFLRFFYFNDLEILEENIDDVAYYSQEADATVHYQRDIYFLYGGSKQSSGYQCGIEGTSSDAFSDVYDAKLSGSSLMLYEGTRNVNSCLSWDLGTLHKDETKDITILMVMGHSEEEIFKVYRETQNTTFDQLLGRTKDFWTGWLETSTPELGNEPLRKMMKRSLLVLKLLTDRNHGGIVAAPCMTPSYRFCWPRDATFTAYALDKCGFHQEAEKFYKWCKKTQEPEGGLYQRYYIEAGIKGPCWSSQIDEIATVIWGIGKHYELTEDRAFIEAMWPTIKQAANLFSESMTSDNLIHSVGLWEEQFGIHTYSNASVCNALKTSAMIAKSLNEETFSKKWNSIAEKMKSALIKQFWSQENDRFIKTYDPNDNSVDASLLGLTFPFQILPAQDQRMRKTASAIEQVFNYEIGGIGRYPEDDYYGGNPWILTTLWLALFHGQLNNVSKMEHLIQWSIDHATELGLLPEQIDKVRGTAVSAVPLAWSHAFLILAILRLHELRKDKRKRVK